MNSSPKLATPDFENHHGRLHDLVRLIVCAKIAFLALLKPGINFGVGDSRTARATRMDSPSHPFFNQQHSVRVLTAILT